jgi:hypothetical protein
MEYEVTMYAAGQTFIERVITNNHETARKVAVARNPNAKILGTNVKLGN